MNTRAKNKSKHPAAPVMTPAQLAAAGISQQKRSKKKPTKDQHIAALEEDLRATRELLRMHCPSGTAPNSSDNGGDTEPATDDDTPTGHKRNPPRSAGGGIKLKRSRAMDPFETERIHPGTTGLVDNWRLKLTPAPSILTLRTSESVTPEYQQSPSPGASAAIPTPLSVEDNRAVYSLPRIVDRQKVYPGIKDLPFHIRTNFRNTFIRLVIRDVFTSKQPWVNPDLSMLQLAYDKIYPLYPARLRANDAIFHPTITSLGVVRNRIGTAAVFAVQRYLTNAFRQKRLQTLDARATFVASQFRSDDDHPFIWRQYSVGDIANHPGTGGYQTTRRGVFQCEPILETLLVYYSSSGIMESVPTEDPGEGNRPVGALAMVAAAVERAYRMHSTGDYIEATQSFNAEFWGNRTALFAEYIAEDLTERQWDGISRALAAVSSRVAVEVAASKGVPQAPRERVPLPPSDPPSPPAED